MNTHSIEEIKDLSKKHPIIAFDGYCNLCNGFIQWLIKRDSRKQFRYTTLQSDEGEQIKQTIEIEGESVLLVYNERVYSLSDVGLKCMEILGGGWKVLSWLIYLPKGFRDFIYNWIAKNRYKWFGKTEACMLPDPAIKSLFL